MGERRLWLLPVVFVALALAPACGGGGGGGGGAAVLALQSIQVTSQPQGPLSPFGTTAGGDTVLVNGTGFETGATVRFGGAAATILNVASRQIEAVTPRGAEGLAAVTVTNPDGGFVTRADLFQYVAPPVIFQVRALEGPTTGENRAPIAGDIEMEIVGDKFRDGAEVEVDGRSVVTTFDSDTRVTFRLPVDPTGSEQAVDVTITNPEGLISTLNRGLVFTQEFSLDPANNLLTTERANHLYRRAGFGAPPATIARSVSEGLGATVTRLLSYTNDAQVEQDALTIYGANPPPVNGINDRTNKEWWIHMLLKNPNPFQERLAFFLHDHFATSERAFNADARWFLHEQVKLFRRFSLATTQTLSDGSPGLGFDWRRLLVEVGKDRAMLDWLDGRLSRVGNPNENYARELWELFMLGEGRGYTEDDIKEAARAFTGFLWVRHTDGYLEMQYRENRHDKTSKTFLGATGRFGYDSISPFHNTTPGLETDPDDDEGVVSVTLRRRPVEASTFICRKLLEFFLYEDPWDGMVDALAQDLRAPGPAQWNLRPILERILESKAMYSSRAMKGKVKNPIEFGIGFLRTTQIDLDSRLGVNASRVRDRLIRMGQVVLDPPDVNGWPSGVAWMGAQSNVERFNFLNFAVQQLDDISQIEPLLPPAGQRSPAQLVDHLASLLDVKLSGNARNRAIAYVTTQLSGDQVLPFNFDPNNDSHLRLKARGLLWQLAQYHDAHQD